MPDAFTCPHCDAALELPAATPTQAVLCPCCRGRLPNPHQEGEGQAEGEEQPLLAREVDEERLRAPDSGQFGCVAVLGLIGAIVAALLFFAVVEIFAGNDRLAEQAALVIGFVASLSLYCFAYFLALRGRRPASSVGLAVLVAFAVLGGFSLAAGVSLLGLVVLFVMVSGFA